MHPFKPPLFWKFRTTNSYPRIVDASERRLRLVEDEEGGEVGGVGGHDYHGEASPHHPEHPSRKAPGSACKKKEKWLKTSIQFDKFLRPLPCLEIESCISGQFG